MPGSETFISALVGVCGDALERARPLLKGERAKDAKVAKVVTVAAAEVGASMSLEGRRNRLFKESLPSAPGLLLGGGCCCAGSGGGGAGCPSADAHASRALDSTLSASGSNSDSREVSTACLEGVDGKIVSLKALGGANSSSCVVNGVIGTSEGVIGPADPAHGLGLGVGGMTTGVGSTVVVGELMLRF